jgi:WhiB family redox-sensing transcriptional regulator
VFYSDDREDQEAALAVCAGCGFVVDCLFVALVDREPAGVWGGQTADARLST